ncbi:MAG: GNAT family N-acetyltransferase [Candidatus Beckwithbacteria bacterium]
MNVIFRKATSKDWKTIQKLNYQAMKANFEYNKFIKPNWEFTKWGENYFKNITKDKIKPCFIAKLDDKPIGYLNGYQKNQGHRTIKTAEIENVAVLPSHQSQGIGSQLINEFKAWCKQKNITHLWVNVYSKNKRAIKLYKKLGLKPIDISFEGKI